MTKVFKIRATKGPNAGKFSSGGSTISWGARGKSWRILGHIKSHMNQNLIRIDLRSPKFAYAEAAAEIVEYELMEVNTTPIQQYIDEIVKKQQEEEERINCIRQKTAERKERQELEQLAKKHGKKLVDV